jgi:penicillin-binding protein 1A
METAFLMSTMLADVINRGTGTGARAGGFRLPAGGKTGTTDNYADAWFVGFTPHIVTGVWFGRDMPGEIMRGGYAATVAVPAWAQFMKAATKGDKPEWVSMPGTLERLPICPLSGLVATDDCRYAAEMNETKVVDDFFQRGTSRPPLCPGHSGESEGGDNN